MLDPLGRPLPCIDEWQLKLAAARWRGRVGLLLGLLRGGGGMLLRSWSRQKATAGTYAGTAVCAQHASSQDVALRRRRRPMNWLQVFAGPMHYCAANSLHPAFIYAH
jgi:hypothetical protein